MHYWILFFYIHSYFSALLSYCGYARIAFSGNFCYCCSALLNLSALIISICVKIGRELFTRLIPVKIRLAFAWTHLSQGTTLTNYIVGWFKGTLEECCTKGIYFTMSYRDFHMQHQTVVVVVVVVVIIVAVLPAKHTIILLTDLMSDSLKVCMFLPRPLPHRILGFENGLCFGTSEKICPSDHAMRSSANIFDRSIRMT